MRPSRRQREAWQRPVSPDVGKAAALAAHLADVNAGLVPDRTGFVAYVLGVDV